MFPHSVQLGGDTYLRHRKRIRRCPFRFSWIPQSRNRVECKWRRTAQVRIHTRLCLRTHELLLCGVLSCCLRKRKRLDPISFYALVSYNTRLLLRPRACSSTCASSVDTDKSKL